MGLLGGSRLSIGASASAFQRLKRGMRLQLRYKVMSYAGPPGTEWTVPTLFRLLFVIGVLVALVWGSMLAMVTYLKPQPREITRDVQVPGTRK